MHHTKTKADIGVGKVITDLLMKGYVPCIPLSEHQPYDIVAISSNGKAFRLQVKYATLKKNGTIDVKFRRTWIDNYGVHSVDYGENEFDFYALYCPEKEFVLYVPNQKHCPKSIRFDKTANNQEKYVKWARDYLLLGAESSETIRHTPETVKT